MSTIGTSYFTSKPAAIRYYAECESGTRTQRLASATTAVEQKLAEGEIHLGIPPLKWGDTTSVIDSGTRYAITRKDTE